MNAKGHDPIIRVLTGVHGVNPKEYLWKTQRNTPNNLYLVSGLFELCSGKIEETGLEELAKITKEPMLFARDPDSLPSMEDALKDLDPKGDRYIYPSNDGFLPPIGIMGLRGYINLIRGDLEVTSLFVSPQSFGEFGRILYAHTKSLSTLNTAMGNHLKIDHYEPN